MKISELKKVYFIGIGGIGMSAIARYFLSLKIEVHGYDKTKTELTEKLEKQGMQIHYKERLDLIPEDIDLVIYTPAIPQDNIEFSHLLKSQILIKKRAEVLGWISKEKKTIAIAGTHGKTTTSTILTHLLKEGGIDCTAFLGGISMNYQSNYVQGNNELIVVEADEYDRSFLHLSPDIAAILSIDADHLDIYKDKDQMKSSGFEAFVDRIVSKGKLFLKDGIDLEIKHEKNLRVETYGLDSGDHCSFNIEVENQLFGFNYKSKNVQIDGLKFTLSGKHNVENATVAIGIALELKVNPEDIRRALLSFEGIKRRFNIVYRTEAVCLIDDYAHHPAELRAAIEAARQMHPRKKITAVFQPHLFSRTKDFAIEFAEELEKLDEVILLPIYPAREKPIKGISSKMLLDKIKNKEKSLVEKDTLLRKLNEKNIEIVLMLGAGDIDKLVEPVKRLMQIRFD